MVRIIHLVEKAITHVPCLYRGKKHEWRFGRREMLWKREPISECFLSFIESSLTTALSLLTSP